MSRSLLVGVGANLTSTCHGAPIDTCRWAIRRLVSISGVKFKGISSFYASAPIPASNQPDYVNAVVNLEATLDPASFLQELHRVEGEAGRVRSELNAARVLDLDLLAAGDLVVSKPDLVLPHPRLVERAFVLYPLCDVAPDWRHPLLGLTARQLRDQLPTQRIERRPDTTEDLLLRAHVLT